VPVQAATGGPAERRSRVFRGSGTVEVSADAFEQAQVTTGATSSEFGNAQAGVVSIATKVGGTKYNGTLSYENDAVTGANSLGFNRITGGFGGPLGVQGLSFYLSGTLEGQQAIPTGKDADKLKLFAPAGIDTVVKVPSTVGDPTADTTLVPVRAFARVTGDCESFSSSVNPGIASNYGVDCEGGRFPQTARSSYQASAKLNYSYGTGSRISVTGLRSQFQGRLTGSDVNWAISEYYRLTNPANQFGFRNWSDFATINWTQNLSKSAERALALETYFSYQKDHTIVAPLTQEGWRSSLDPFGGFMIGGLDFLWDLNSFPIDDELINNFRVNEVGSRRRPIPVEDLTSYEPVKAYRTNAYGMEPASARGLLFGRPDATSGEGAAPAAGHQCYQGAA
jgi:hypothetical protein